MLTVCDNFYLIYCQNIVNEYENKNPNTSFDYSEFGRNINQNVHVINLILLGFNHIEEEYPQNVLCQDVVGASGEAMSTYIDPQSRSSTCNMTICNSSINFSGITAGEDVGIQQNIEQQCGNNSPSFTGVSGSTAVAGTSGNAGTTSTSSGTATPVTGSSTGSSTWSNSNYSTKLNYRNTTGTSAGTISTGTSTGTSAGASAETSSSSSLSSYFAVGGISSVCLCIIILLVIGVLIWFFMRKKHS